MPQDLKETAEYVVRRAIAKGASDADTFIREDETFSVTVRMGDVETLKESVSRGLRLRLFVGKKTATSQTSDLSPAVLDSLVDETVEMARLTSDDQSGGLGSNRTLNRRAGPAACRRFLGKCFSRSTH